jgi:hypothetical protein
MTMSYKTRGELLASAADAPQRASDRAEYIRAGIAAGVGEMYRAPTFARGFGRFVCVGDSIECHYNGFRIVARIEHDADTNIDDNDCHPIEFDPEMFDTREQHAAALKVRQAWLDDEWHYCGVVLSVTRAGIMLAEHAASLWGIECNYPGSDNQYLTIVAHELAPEALKEASAALERLQVTERGAARYASALEQAIDAHTLHEIVYTLAAICNEKADHIRQYADSASLASDWDRAGDRLAIVAGRLGDL